jgi:antitoxin HicB
MTKATKKQSPRSTAELSTLDDFLKAEGKLEEFQAIAIKEVLDWQIAKGIRPAKARNPKLNRPRARSD